MAHVPSGSRTARSGWDRQRAAQAAGRLPAPRGPTARVHARRQVRGPGRCGSGGHPQDPTAGSRQGAHCRAMEAIEARCPAGAVLRPGLRVRVQQITGTLTADTPQPAGRALLVFAVLWWSWGAYAWLTNAVDTSATGPRLVILLAARPCSSPPWPCPPPGKTAAWPSPSATWW